MTMSHRRYDWTYTEQCYGDGFASVIAGRVSFGIALNTEQSKTLMCEAPQRHSKEKAMKAVLGGRLGLAAAFVILVFGSTFALAQGIVTGSISGMVQDPQG